MAIVENIKRIPLWSYLFLIGFITFFTYDIIITSDMGWYMNSALNILLGNGYTNMDGSLILNRGPIFPLMIVASYCLLGTAPWSAFWVVRIFCVLNPIMIYFIGKKIYGKWVGFSAAILILTSYSINTSSYRHIDAIWPFFIFLSIYLIYTGMKEDKNLYLAYAGVSIGLSFLIKEVAILFFVLPFLVIFVIGQFCSKRNFKKILIFYVTLFLSIAPWLIYQLIYGGVHSILGNAGPTVIESILNPSREVVKNGSESLFSIVGIYVDGLISYYKGQGNSLSSNFILSPIFILGWGLILLKSFTRDNSSKLLLCSLVCFLPIFYFMGISNFRIGQGLYFYYLSYLVFAYFTFFLSKVIFKLISRAGMPTNKLNQNIIFAFIIVLTMGIQFFFSHLNDFGGKRFFVRSYSYKSFVADKSIKKIVGLYGNLDKTSGEWIKKNIPNGSHLMVSKPSEGKGIYFYSGGQYPMFIMPVIQSNKLAYVEETRTGDSVIFVSSWIPKIDPRNKIFSLTQKQLFNSLKKYKIEYIIVNKKRNYLSLYFNEHPGFSRVAEVGDGKIKIYKVDFIEENINFKPMISQNIVVYFRKLKKKDPLKIDYYVDNYFKPLLGWNREIVEQMISVEDKQKFKKFTYVNNGKVY